MYIAFVRIYFKLLEILFFMKICYLHLNLIIFRNMIFLFFQAHSFVEIKKRNSAKLTLFILFQQQEKTK